MPNINSLFSSFAAYLHLNNQPASIVYKYNKFIRGWSVVANLPIEESEKEGVHILRVGGRLDSSSAPVFERKMVHIIETPGAKLIVDFKNLSYLSSAGMRVMLAASKRLKHTAGTVVFCSVQAPVMEIIKLAGFEHILKFYPTELSALKALKPPNEKE